MVAYEKTCSWIHLAMNCGFYSEVSKVSLKWDSVERALSLTATENNWILRKPIRYRSKKNRHGGDNAH